MMILHHYCSSPTFKSIVESRSIRLSSLLQSNDSMEGKLAAEAMSRLAAKDGLDATATGDLLQGMELVLQFDGLGFCMSEEPDLLSQWRGYGDDGYGFSVGFSADYFSKMKDSLANQKSAGIYLEKVEYDLSRHDEALRPYYERLSGVLRSKYLRKSVPKAGARRGKPENWGKFFLDEMAYGAAVGSTLEKVFCFKSPAFREEREWRLLSHIKADSLDGLATHARREQLVIFQPVKLVPLGVEPIQCVLLGPKNRTPMELARRFLQENGFSKVRVERSSATYR